ncbi:MAG: hypothetical protein M1812_007454 [Candelaria pacifica]|nr:MAG: hypothetical protein M1812_007454 [Candelaria pacifica]
MEERVTATTSGTSTSSDKPTVLVRDLGLTVLYEPRDSPVADVIFVHGLQGHPRKTWCYEGPIESSEHQERAKSPGRRLLKKFGKSRNSKAAEKLTQSVFWPADLLPNDHKCLRILTFGYDSNVTNIGGLVNKNNISQHGRGLLAAVLTDRKRLDCLARPLIFVAHSLGGLLVKEALIESQKQGKSHPEDDLSKTCPAIIFLGTPHRGSSDAHWGQILSNIAGAVQIDTNNSILRDLDPSSGSSKLEDLRRDFGDILDEGLIRIYSFQESAGKTSLRFAGGKVVPDESSSFDSRRLERIDTIDANHMNMCRFRGQHDEGYNKFLGAVAGVLKGIQEQSRRAEAGKMEAEKVIETQHREELLRGLDYHERVIRERQVYGTNAQAATMKWVWSMPAGQSSFKQWLASNETFFWISGKPGSGKSTLMAHLREDDNTSSLLHDGSPRPWAIVNFYFDFRAGKNTSNNFEGLLRSLLIQLIAFEDFDLPAHESRKRRPTSYDTGQWDKTSLRALLKETIKEGSKNVCMFIDGLDEYEGDMLELLALFRGIAAGNIIDALPTVKICFASRPEPVILLNLKTCPGLRMQQFNSIGIEQYVSTVLHDAVPSDSERLNSISADIATRAEGVFLWARFATSELIVGFARGDDLEELRERLEQLSPDLEKLYDRVFDRLTPKDRKLASIMFRLVCFRADPSLLSVQGLMLAVDMAMGKKVHHDRFLDKELSEDLRKRLMARSGGLLEIAQRYMSACNIRDKGQLNASIYRSKEYDEEVRLTHRTV